MEIFAHQMRCWDDFLQWKAEEIPLPPWCKDVFRRMFVENDTFAHFLRHEWNEECIYIKHDLLCQLFEHHRSHWTEHPFAESWEWYMANRDGMILPSDGVRPARAREAEPRANPMGRTSRMREPSIPYTERDPSRFRTQQEPMEYEEEEDSMVSEEAVPAQGRGPPPPYGKGGRFGKGGKGGKSGKGARFAEDYGRELSPPSKHLAQDWAHIPLGRAGPRSAGSQK